MDESHPGIGIASHMLRQILAADPDTPGDLCTIALTMGRMSGINKLIWQDVDFQKRCVIVSTLKKRGPAGKP